MAATIISADANAPWWVWLPFWLYISGALGWFAIWAAFMMRIALGTHGNAQIESLGILYKLRFTRSSWLTQLIHFCVAAISLFTASLAWPAILLYSIWKCRTFTPVSPLRRIAMVRAKNILIPYEFFLICATSVFTWIIVGTLLIRGEMGRYGSLLVGLLSLFVTGRLIVHALTVRTLLHLNRSAPGHPHVRFFVMGLVYALMIVAVFLPRQPSFPAFYESLGATISAIFAFTNLRSWQSLNLNNLLSVQMAVTGFLFYIIIFRSLLRRSEFRRTEQDIVVIADALSMKGDFMKALSWLKKAPASSTPVIFQRANALMGVNEVESATALMCIVIPALHQELDKLGASAHIMLLGAARQYPFPRASVRALFNAMVHEQPREVHVFASLMHLEELYGADFVNRELDMKGLATTCPATYAARLLRLGHRKESEEYIRKVDRTEPENDALCRVLELWSLLEQETNADDRRQWVDIWLQDSMPVIRKAIAGIHDTWVKAYGFIVIALLAHIAKDIGSEYSEHLKHAAREVADNIQAEDKTGIIWQSVTRIARVSDF